MVYLNALCVPDYCPGLHCVPMATPAQWGVGVTTVTMGAIHRPAWSQLTLGW